MALIHEIEVRILAGQPEGDSGVGGPRAVLKSRRNWFDSSGSHQGAQKLKGERPAVNRVVVGSIPTWAASSWPGAES